jgi:hypothetical protein
LPPSAEHAVFRDIRSDASLPTSQVVGPRFDELGTDVRSAFTDEFAMLAVQHNPIVHRVVRRTRTMLEERGLLKPIAVLPHPKASDGLPSRFKEAYAAAEAFSSTIDYYLSRGWNSRRCRMDLQCHPSSVAKAGGKQELDPIGLRQ